ncbi:MAG: hypothetical protein K1X28_10165 [Parachlamydiales bacterium]|nr:hypothetical protein [Parachlamydiales bacterium]
MAFPAQKIWCAKGFDPFWAYRDKNDKPNEYLFHQGHIAFYSPKSHIPAVDFSKIINHYLSGLHDCAEIGRLEKKYSITKVVEFDDFSSLLGKGTITGGSHLMDLAPSRVRIIDRSNH